MLPSLETQLIKQFCKLCNVMCHSWNNFVSFKFKFCVSKVTNLTSRNQFYAVNLKLKLIQDNAIQYNIYIFFPIIREDCYIMWRGFQ